MIYLSPDDVELLASTPPRECFICDEILNQVSFQRIDSEWLEEQGYMEHLEQLTQLSKRQMIKRTKQVDKNKRELELEKMLSVIH